MEQTQEQNKSLAQQLVDEYYGHYKSMKPSEAELPNILSIVEFMLDKFYYHNGINLEPIKDSKMTVERIKEIQLTTGYPDSVSVQQALLQVWNEVAQEINQVQKQNKENEMVLTKEQYKQLEEVTKPVIEWLDNNFHPHTSIVITNTYAELIEGIASVGEVKESIITKGE